MEKTYVAKRFRTFRRPIRRQYATGGIICNENQNFVDERFRSVTISVNSIPNPHDIITAIAKWNGGTR